MRFFYVSFMPRKIGNIFASSQNSTIQNVRLYKYVVVVSTYIWVLQTINKQTHDNEIYKSQHQYIVWFDIFSIYSIYTRSRKMDEDNSLFLWCYHFYSYMKSTVVTRSLLNHHVRQQKWIYGSRILTIVWNSKYVDDKQAVLWISFELEK